MFTRILSDTLDQIQRYERDNPEEARCLAPSLRDLKMHLQAVLDFIEQPTAEDIDEAEAQVRRLM